MSESEESTKRKGGAEKIRDKKKRILENDAKMCGDIRNMFFKSKVLILYYYILLTNITIRGFYSFFRIFLH